MPRIKGVVNALTTLRCVSETAVKPKRTYFTYEVFMYNSIDCPEQYARIFKAVDREKCGAHIELANMMRSPRELYQAKELTEKCVAVSYTHLEAHYHEWDPI